MFISANIQFAKLCCFLASSNNFLEGSLPYQVKVNTSYNGKQVIIKCLTLRDHQIKDCQQEQKANMYSLKRTFVFLVSASYPKKTKNKKTTQFK